MSINAQSAVAKTAAAKAAQPVVETAITPTIEPVESTASLAPVQAEPEETGWNLRDGQWVPVPKSQAITASDVNQGDPFALPKTLVEKNAEMDFMHGGDNPIVMQQLEARGWAVWQGKVTGAMVKDGAPRLLGPDAPLMYRPKAVAHLFGGKDENPAEARRKETKAVFDEMAKEMNRKDRSIRISGDELMGMVDGMIDVRDEDPTGRMTNALLAHKQAEDAERRGGIERSSHFFSLPETLAASLRQRQATRA